MDKIKLSEMIRTIAIESERLFDDHSRDYMLQITSKVINQKETGIQIEYQGNLLKPINHGSDFSLIESEEEARKAINSMIRDFKIIKYNATLLLNKFKRHEDDWFVSLSVEVIENEMS